MRRRVPVQEEEPVQDVIDEPREDGEIERYIIDFKILILKNIKY